MFPCGLTVLIAVSIKSCIRQNLLLSYKAIIFHSFSGSQVPGTAGFGPLSAALVAHGRWKATHIVSSPWSSMIHTTVQLGSLQVCSKLTSVRTIRTFRNAHFVLRICFGTSGRAAREGDEPFFLNKPLTNHREADRRMACKAMTSWPGKSQEKVTKSNGYKILQSSNLFQVAWCFFKHAKVCISVARYQWHIDKQGRSCWLLMF